jgi:putative nucleotidyltransferase with HDIG domain
MNVAVDTSRILETPRRAVDPSRSAWQEPLVRLLDVMEGRNRALRNHADRVEGVSRQIALNLGVSGESLFCLQIAALLHDIGKIGLPDQILDKPGRFTRQEFDVMKAHSLQGEKILRDTGLPDRACRAVRWHHESCDGTGYPDGLHGEEIPLEARILCVADAYVALTEDRPCRPALSFRTASDWIATLSGIRFDPEVVGCLLNGRSSPALRGREALDSPFLESGL